MYVSGTEELWPYLLLVNAGPAIVSLLFMPCLPDSPRYLAITCNRRQDAIKGQFVFIVISRLSHIITSAREFMFSSVLVTLFVGMHDYAKTTESILTKFGGTVAQGPRKKLLNFVSNPVRYIRAGLLGLGLGLGLVLVFLALALFKAKVKFNQTKSRIRLSAVRLRF